MYQSTTKNNIPLYDLHHESYDSVSPSTYPISRSNTRTQALSPKLSQYPIDSPSFHPLPPSHIHPSARLPSIPQIQTQASFSKSLHDHNHDHKKFDNTDEKDEAEASLKAFKAAQKASMRPRNDPEFDRHGEGGWGRWLKRVGYVGKRHLRFVGPGLVSSVAYFDP